MAMELDNQAAWKIDDFSRRIAEDTLPLTDLDLENRICGNWKKHGEKYTYLGVRDLIRDIVHRYNAHIQRMEGVNADALAAEYLRGYTDAQARYGQSKEGG